MENFTFQTIIENNKSFSYFLIFMGYFSIVFVTFWISTKVKNNEFKTFLQLISPIVFFGGYLFLSNVFLWDFINSSFTTIYNFEEQKEYLYSFNQWKIFTLYLCCFLFLLIFIRIWTIYMSLSSLRKSTAIYTNHIAIVSIFSLVLGYIIILVEKYSN